uniref:Serine carboxypeptidase-like 4 n=1 Tax=Cajanus cajan TaxID=3821 RepID=A0A151R5Y0_CAJCA|nr:Serine carboxypeptidase-like 4 [Cajanus cajan]
MNGNYTGSLPKLELNPYSWSDTLNMMYIDIPVGTGFSYSETQEGYYSSDVLWVEHAYEFLQKTNFIQKNMSMIITVQQHKKRESLPYPRPTLINSHPTSLRKRAFGLLMPRGYLLASPAVDTYQDTNMKVLYAYQRTLIPEALYKVRVYSIPDRDGDVDENYISDGYGYGDGFESQRRGRIS